MLRLKKISIKNQVAINRSKLTVFNVYNLNLQTIKNQNFFPR